MRTSIPFNNFAFGQIDRDLKGRFDLPLCQNGLEIMRNFYPTIKGNAIFRTGFEFIDEIGHAALYEFKFNKEQCYLMVFSITHIKFYSYSVNGEFVRVLDNDGNPLQIAHPWGSEVFNLSMTQNSDIVYITHIYNNYPEHKLKRTASNVFVLEQTPYTEGNLGSNGEAHGYPAAIVFYENALFRANSKKIKTGLYRSKGGDYDNMKLGTNTNDGLQFDLAEAISPIIWLMGGKNSLLAGTQEGILTINGGGVNTAITPETITAKLSCAEGASLIKPISKDEFILYISQNRRALYAFRYDTLSEQFVSTNLSKGNYDITKGLLSKLVYKQDKNNFIYTICDGKLLSITLSNEENVNGWAEHLTNGKILDICGITRPDGETDLFANIKRIVNGVERYYLERLSDFVEFSRLEDFISMEGYEKLTPTEKIKVQDDDKKAFYRVVADELRKCNYLDSSKRYDGLKQNKLIVNDDILECSDGIFTQSDVGRRIWVKTTSGREYGSFEVLEVVDPKRIKVKTLLRPTLNVIEKWYFSATVFKGLEHLEGELVGVVGNGGYIGDFKVVNGQVDISDANVNKVGTAVIGLKYTGIMKSNNLGLLLQGIQTLTTPKKIYKIALRLYFSAGGKAGDSLYELKDIQQFKSDGLYDIPPLPMDGDEDIKFPSSYKGDKCYYIVQDSPLPFQVAMVIPYYEQNSNT